MKTFELGHLVRHAVPRQGYTLVAQIAALREVDARSSDERYAVFYELLSPIEQGPRVFRFTRAGEEMRDGNICIVLTHIARDDANRAVALLLSVS